MSATAYADVKYGAYVSRSTLQSKEDEMENKRQVPECNEYRHVLIYKHYPTAHVLITQTLLTESAILDIS